MLSIIEILESFGRKGGYHKIIELIESFAESECSLDIFNLAQLMLFISKTCYHFHR
jgi:hypothetical protein